MNIAALIIPTAAYHCTRKSGEMDENAAFEPESDEARFCHAQLFYSYFHEYPPPIRIFTYYIYVCYLMCVLPCAN